MFSACKQISALNAARRIRLPLKQKGRRYWTCCPLHGEKTPSMMFDENGRWYCFGCNKGGDAVDLYAEFFKERPYQAAKHLATDFGIAGGTLKPRRAMPRKLFRELAEDLLCRRERHLLLLKYSAKHIRYYSEGEMLWNALKIESDADIEIMNIDVELEHQRVYRSNLLA